MRGSPTSKLLRGGWTTLCSLDVVKNVGPLTAEQISALGARAKQAAMTGKYELFTTTNHFDSTAQKPLLAWLIALIRHITRLPTHAFPVFQLQHYAPVLDARKKSSRSCERRRAPG
jgi:hypothetical protein